MSKGGVMLNFATVAPFLHVATILTLSIFFLQI
jgi:hypothetical protein